MDILHLLNEIYIKMKKNKIIGIAMLFLLVLLQSCKEDDIYYNLPQEARDVLLFEVNDTFQLRNQTTDEIITFTITDKEIDFSENGSNISPFYSFGSSRDIFFEYGIYDFVDSTNCYRGSVFVRATRDEDFEFKIGFTEMCTDSIDDNYETYEEALTSTTVEGISYTNLLSLRASNFNTLFYSKEKGILKIESLFFGETLFTIVE